MAWLKITCIIIQRKQDDKQNNNAPNISISDGIAYNCWVNNTSYECFRRIPIFSLLLITISIQILSDQHIWVTRFWSNNFKNYSNINLNTDHAPISQNSPQYLNSQQTAQLYTFKPKKISHSIEKNKSRNKSTPIKCSDQRRSRHSCLTCWTKLVCITTSKQKSATATPR